jgi:hypothetical protein
MTEQTMRKQTMRKQTMTEKPYFIILGGPTGSGKSLMPQLILNYLRKTNGVKYHFKKLLIDDYIEYNPLYKESIHNIIEEYNCVPRKTGKGDKCDVETPSTELANAFEEIYFHVRRKGQCYGDFTQDIKDKIVNTMYDNIKKKYRDNDKRFETKEESKQQYQEEIGKLKTLYDKYYEKNCEEQYISDIINYLNNNNNIIVETTGKKIPKDLIKLVNQYDYNIIIAYILVEKNELRERIIKRFRDALYKFRLDYEKKAPRFPNISDKIINNIKETLITLRNECLPANEESEICEFINKDSNINLLIFDNTDSSFREPKLVYDHTILSDNHLFMDNKKYIKFINNILGIPNVISPKKQTRLLLTQLPNYIENGGKNKRTTRKYRSVRKTKKNSKDE